MGIFEMARKAAPAGHGSDRTRIRSRVTLSRNAGSVREEVALPGERATDAPSSPEPQNANASSTHLFVESLGSGYATALSARLDGRCLPWRSLDILVEVLFTSVAGMPRFEAVIVSPTIAGGDPSVIAAYRHAANEVRDRCAIGRAIRGNVAYRVGGVAVIDGGPPQTGGHTDESRHA
jgi:organic hydroperoxide reductase OsmC/OhrA